MQTRFISIKKYKAPAKYITIFLFFFFIIICFAIYYFYTKNISFWFIYSSILGLMFLGKKGLHTAAYLTLLVTLFHIMMLDKTLLLNDILMIVIISFNYYRSYMINKLKQVLKQNIDKSKKLPHDQTECVVKNDLKNHLITTAIEQAEESVFITDLQGSILYVNPAFEKIIGYKKKEIIGKNYSILKSGKHDSEFYEAILKLLNCDQESWKGRIINRRKDNTLIETDTTISPVKDKLDKITNYIFIKRDVTEEVKLKKQLQHAQKMEALGTLAGGIAHDFNNILFPLICYAEICMDDIVPESVVYQNLGAMLQGLNRAKDLVDQILIFSRQSDNEELKPLYVNLIMKEVLKLIRPSIPSNIKIKSFIKSECSPIIANMTQIHQVIMNLCSNAVHAMQEKGGVLEIHMNEIDDHLKEYQDIPNASAHSYLQITVKDTGHGMDQSVMGRIFDPYFTTKAPNQGTGLGLAVVHDIIQKHRGHISVSSIIGQGSCFKVYLPQADVSKVQENNNIKKDENVLPANKEIHILLVEDEHNIANMVTLMLERKGYKVTAETNSLKAFEIFKQDYANIDLVITDQIMPNITGVELSNHIKKIRPDIPIIIITGNKNFVENYQKESVNICLQKPISSTIVLKAVHEALTTRSKTLFKGDHHTEC